MIAFIFALWFAIVSVPVEQPLPIRSTVKPADVCREGGEWVIYGGGGGGGVSGGGGCCGGGGGGLIPVGNDWVKP